MFMSINILTLDSYVLDQEMILYYFQMKKSEDF